MEKAESAMTIDPKFKYEVCGLSGAERIMLCFQCGTCTADCPIARFSDLYKPRRIVRMVQFGLRDKLLSNTHLWLCSKCFNCVDQCPQKVEVASIVMALTNLMVKEKRVIPSVYKALLSNLMKTGYVYIIPESRVKKRSEDGLPPLPKANIDDIIKIFNATGMAAILEDVEVFEKVKIE
ncbi:MAG: 4Fe-4S dicluster domain-containing protein [Nitrososphaerota archaeon]|nr:4Fe-4S dicluster domain-containing protein [Candidatus Bathyarchaeota archaeon]MDW8048428.1 4Fe-4S dicluster domain-containing protein [Nitrososphaerota archaeon]